MAIINLYVGKWSSMVVSTVIEIYCDYMPALKGLRLCTDSPQLTLLMYGSILISWKTELSFSYY